MASMPKKEINMLKASIIALSLAAPFAAALPTQASAAVDFVVRIAPPAPRYEVVPPPRPGYLWTPGYWSYRNNQHYWIAGTWVRERPGYVYNHPTWVERDGEWRLSQGNWARNDRDHDGIKNSRDHDRDGDGVRNRADPHPNVPGR